MVVPKSFTHLIAEGPRNGPHLWRFSYFLKIRFRGCLDLVSPVGSELMARLSQMFKVFDESATGSAWDVRATRRQLNRQRADRPIPTSTVFPASRQWVLLSQRTQQSCWHPVPCGTCPHPDSRVIFDLLRGGKLEKPHGVMVTLRILIPLF